MKRDGRVRKGIRNAIMTHVRIPTSTTETTEWAIIAPFGDPPLVSSGDSGAWCYSPKADAFELQLLGMVFARSVDWSMCYVTPMKVILEDIQEQTGLCVRLPETVEA